MKTRNIIVVILGLFLLAGCVTVKPTVDPVIPALLYSEAGFNLAYYCLRSEDDVVLDRTEKAIKTAKEMLESTEVTEMVDIMITYIEDSPQFQTVIRDEYRPVITSSIRLLKALVQIEIETTEDVEKVKKGLVLFLNGALDGIDELRKD